MLNFFAIVLIIFIGILILVFKKRRFKKLINKVKFHAIKIKKHKKNNNQFVSNKKSFLYNHEEKKYSIFYKNSQRNKMFSLFQGNTENKLKALKIAEELSDKSTLSILRQGLRDMAPEVVKLSALLIRKFK
jgi:type III secretory pathway component EscR